MKMTLTQLPDNAQKDTREQRGIRLHLIFAAMTQGIRIYDSCKLHGVTYRSFHRWINKDPELMAMYEQAKKELHEQVGEMAKLCALKALDDPRYQTSMIFYLKSKAGWNDGTGFTLGTVMPSITYSDGKNKQE